MYPRRRYPTLVIASGTAFFPVSELQSALADRREGGYGIWYAMVQGWLINGPQTAREEVGNVPTTDIFSHESHYVWFSRPLESSQSRFTV